MGTRKSPEKDGKHRRALVKHLGKKLVSPILYYSWIVNNILYYYAF